MAELFLHTDFDFGYTDLLHDGGEEKRRYVLAEEAVSDDVAIIGQLNQFFVVGHTLGTIFRAQRGDFMVGVPLLMKRVCSGNGE